MFSEDLKRGFKEKLRLARDSEEAKSEVKRHVMIWNNVAEFMGYGVLFAPNLSEFIPIYFNKRFPNGKTYSKTDGGLFTDVGDYNPVQDALQTFYVKKFQIKEWMPTLDFNHAKEVERKLLEKGNYLQVEFSPRFNAVSYSRGLFNNVVGNGKNELEAICNACINFNEMIKGTQLKLEMPVKSLNV